MEQRKIEPCNNAITPISIGVYVAMPLEKLDVIIAATQHQLELMEEARREIINRTDANKAG